MVHKAFEVVGKRVLINTGLEEKLGIFQDSRQFWTTLESKPALLFVQPLYETNPIIEKLAKGKEPKERISPKSPVLSLHDGVDQLKLRYVGMRGGVHVFEGELEYNVGHFVNDGNFEAYDRFREPLKKAGFVVE